MGPRFEVTGPMQRSYELGRGPVHVLLGNEFDARIKALDGAPEQAEPLCAAQCRGSG